MFKKNNSERMDSAHSRFSLRIPVKWLGVVSLLAAYIAASFFISAMPISTRRRRSLRAGNTSFFSSRTLALFGVRIHKKHGERLEGARNGCLLVSNHVSYIDVLVISSLTPSVFITSVELKHTPLLGALARFGGSLFVERRKPSRLRREILDISQVLAQGLTVVLFPEGTTSNGESVCQFKNSLFAAAISAGVDILPVCLRYTRINDEAVSVRNKDRVFYYGGVSFSSHFPNFMSLESVDVEVLPLRTIRVRESASRKELAAFAYNAIAEAYGQKRTPISRDSAEREP
jgi:1-acyl-sn-glycerol-3-phosphate acyltransferase